MLVRDFLALPDHVTADEFVVRPNTDAAELARKYTLTSAIEPKLDGLLRDIGSALAANNDIGRFVFGSFGSGKSHFLRITGMMLANDKRLYDNTTDSRILELRNKHPWLEAKKILVVPVLMIDADSDVAAFTRTLAEGFDQALHDRGQPELKAFGTTAAFEAFDRLCSDTPAMFDAFEKRKGYTRSFYEAARAEARAGSISKDLLDFSRTLGDFIMADAASFQPTASEAREQMAAHAKKLGYEAIAFEIDEFILWAQGLTGGGYAAAINALNALVESSDVKPVRFIALAAIQRSVMSFFPETGVDDKLLRDQLARVKDRFPEVRLEDNNLFEIAQRRVLAPRPERKAEWATQVAQVMQRLTGPQNSVLVGDEPPATLAQLYPFHPALLRVLSDVSQGLQRARSSLYMLFQLLTEVCPELEVGDLVSLGALWDVLFAPEHLGSLETYAPKDQPTHHANRLIKTYGTWGRLRSSIQIAAAGNESDRNTLDLAVKSALLAQLSHSPFVDQLRGLDAAITVENLYRLNRTDIPAGSEMNGFIKVGKLLRKLATLEPSAVMVDGETQTAKVKIELDAIDLTELLASLRPNTLFPTLLAQTKNVLGFSNVAGQEGKLTEDWCMSPRSGRIRFETFEQFSASGKGSTLALEPNDEFKLAILMETEYGGSAQQTIDSTRAKIESARDQSQSWAAAWIPNPLSTEGREHLERLAKIEQFEAKQDDYLGQFRAGEHTLVKQRMGSLKSQSQAGLQAALASAYRLGRVITLRKEPPELFAPQNVDLTARPKYYVGQLMDRRYQQHPKFLATPGPSQLNKLLALDRRLLNDATKNVLGGDDLELAKKLGEPLELFEPGAGVTNVKNGGLYLEAIREQLAKGERRVGRLIEILGREPFGLQKSPAQFLIAVFALRLGYRLTLDESPKSIDVIGDLDPRGELALTPPTSIHDWNAARNAASALFGIDDVPVTLHVGNVDGLILKLREPIDRMQRILERIGSTFSTLLSVGAYTGASPAAKRYHRAMLDVAALGENATVIKRLAAIDLEPFRKTFADAQADVPALERLRDFRYLSTVIASSPELKSQLEKILLSDLTSLASDIGRWIDDADAFIKAALKPAPIPSTPPRDLPPPQVWPPPSAPKAVRIALDVPLREPDLDKFLAEVRRTAAAARSGTTLSIEMRIVADSPKTSA